MRSCHVSIFTSMSENAHATLPFTELGTDPYNQMKELLGARAEADLEAAGWSMEAAGKLPRLSVGHWPGEVVVLGLGTFVVAQQSAVRRLGRYVVRSM